MLAPLSYHGNTKQIFQFSRVGIHNFKITFTAHFKINKSFILEKLFLLNNILIFIKIYMYLKYKIIFYYYYEIKNKFVSSNHIKHIIFTFVTI